MDKRLLLIALLASTSTMAANFGTPTTPAAASPTSVKPAANAMVLTRGPQVAGGFRIVKPDGATVIAQGTLSTTTTSLPVINVTDKDAFLTSGGMCAFNVKYDEISDVAATGTTNRIYSNDRLIAQNTKIDLVAGVLRTIWTQPYLVPGVNNVRLVVNADGTAPSTAWIRVVVAGTCGAAVPPPSTGSAPVTTPPKTEPPKPAPAPTPAPVVKYAPGSAEWNNLYTAWGYSNYGTTQLKGKGYARYDELAKLNAAITVVINAKVVEAPTYNSLMTSWNTFVTDPAFKAAMAAIVPNTTGQK